MMDESVTASAPCVCSAECHRFEPGLYPLLFISNDHLVPQRPFPMKTGRVNKKRLQPLTKNKKCALAMTNV